MSAGLDLDGVRADLEHIRGAVADYPYCPGWMQQGIRHLMRNCDVECRIHGEYSTAPDADAECGQPGRYDGEQIARLLNAIPALLARINELEGRS